MYYYIYMIIVSIWSTHNVTLVYVHVHVYARD